MASRRAPLFSVLALCLGALSTLGVWLIAATPATWRLSAREGRPEANGSPVTGAVVLREGDWAETDDRSRARLQVGRLGFVDLGYRTRLQVRQAGRPEHRVVLDRGSLSAHITTSPELFRIETSAARLIGYGGAYSLDVGPAGSGLLRVTAGWAALEGQARYSVVPAGAACPLWADGPGTPYFEDASAAFREALAAVDTRPADSLVRRIAIDVVLSEARARDAITLWHLGARVEASLRGVVLDGLSGLSAPPIGVTRDGMVAGDESMRERWFEALGLGRAPWKGPVAR